MLRAAQPSRFRAPIVVEDAVARRRGEVRIDTDHCKGCGLCVAACPLHCLQVGTTLNRLGYHAAEFLPDRGCSACGVCFYACPEPAAISVYSREETEAA
jgi:Pyruvate/2-oxoacid:ferredoxin oxidoreductase delta subunit